MKWLFGRITDLTPQQYEAILDSLPPSRKARISRIKKEDGRHRSLMASYLVQKLLEEMGRETVVLENAEDGRPYLKGCDLFVSISHSHEGVICAISEDTIGIDIERIRPVRVGLIQYVCTEREREYVLSGWTDIGKEMVEGPVAQRFFAVWTAKEAYFKKSGSGITDIRSIDTLSFAKQTFYIDDFLITVV